MDLKKYIWRYIFLNLKFYSSIKDHCNNLINLSILLNFCSDACNFLLELKFDKVREISNIEIISTTNESLSCVKY